MHEHWPDLTDLGPPAYLVGGLLVLVPFGEAFFSTFPMAPGSAMWRFGAVGIMSSSLLTPVLGILVLLLTAALLEHATWARILGVMAFLAAAVILIVFALFILDAIQIRSQLVEEARVSYQWAAAQTLFRLLAVAGATIVTGIAAWRVSGRIRRSRARKSRSSAPVVAPQ